MKLGNKNCSGITYPLQQEKIVEYNFQNLYNNNIYKLIKGPRLNR